MNKRINTSVAFDSDANEVILALIGKLKRHRKVGLHWDDKDECRCICGNTRSDDEGCPFMRGFEFCDASGNPSDIDTPFERCMDCGHVIQVYALTPINRVVNYRPDLIEESDDAAATVRTNG